MKWLSLAVLSMSALVMAPAAHAIPVTFVAHLDGPSENPVNNSQGVGDTTVVFDLSTHSMTVSATFGGLTGVTTASHIHCCVAPPGNVGVATETPTFSSFPLGVNSGSFNQTYNMALGASYNTPFLAANGNDPAAAEQALFNGLMSGMAYLNIHSNVFPGGEIRGFLSAVPEPETLGILGLGLISLYLVRRQRRT